MKGLIHRLTVTQVTVEISCGESKNQRPVKQRYENFDNGKQGHVYKKSTLINYNLIEGKNVS